MGKHAAGTAAPAESLESVAARLGAVVRADVGDPSLWATILIGHGLPVLTLNVAIVGTDRQEPAVLWALSVIGNGVSGFHLCRADA